MAKIRNTETSPATTAKRYGLRGLKHLSELTDVSTSTLRDWHTSEPKRFKIMCEWAAQIGLHHEL